MRSKLELLFDKTVGSVLRKIRLEKQLTQTQAADLIGIERPDVVLIESGSSSITLFKTILYCKALGIDLVCLMDNLERSVDSQLDKKEAKEVSAQKGLH